MHAVDVVPPPDLQRLLQACLLSSGSARFVMHDLSERDFRPSGDYLFSIPTRLFNDLRRL